MRAGRTYEQSNTVNAVIGAEEGEEEKKKKTTEIEEQQFERHSGDAGRNIDEKKKQRGTKWCERKAERAVP